MAGIEKQNQILGNMQALMLSKQVGDTKTGEAKKDYTHGFMLAQLHDKGVSTTGSLDKCLENPDCTDGFYTGLTLSQISKDLRPENDAGASIGALGGIMGGTPPANNIFDKKPEISED